MATVDVSSSQSPSYVVVTLRGDLDATQSAQLRRALLAAPQPVIRLLFLTGRTGLLPVSPHANEPPNGAPAISLPPEPPIGASNSANSETSPA